MNKKHKQSNWSDPLARRRGTVLIIDGGLATHVEALGENIDHPLWSAICLVQKPDVIKQAHADYFHAGAEVAITASYQAHFGGFKDIGVDEAEALETIKRSVALAREVAPAGALVAGSVGCYGASLHNGAEYTGVYPGMDEDKLLEWHLPRARALATAGCDVLACETIPCLAEARAISKLVSELRVPAWVTYACRSETEVSSGDTFDECIAAVADCEYVVGAGVNCTNPKFVSALVATCRKALPSSKHVIVYPNSGEEWCGETHKWVAGSATADEHFVEMAREWVRLGADCVGGCCRTSPATIRALRDAFPVSATS